MAIKKKPNNSFRNAPPVSKNSKRKNPGFSITSGKLKNPNFRAAYMKIPRNPI
jgi:hypothetical protein